MGGRGASSGKGVMQTAKARREDTVRGVAQSTIDKLRGTREHQNPQSITWKTIQEDYQRVGITITEQEAKDIRESIRFFSYLGDTKMRTALSAQRAGRVLTEDQKGYIEQYKRCMEWCKVAPVIPSDKYHTIYRGIKFSDKTPEYSQKIFALKPGDTWDVDRMPTSFSTSIQTAKSFSYNGSKAGMIIHMPTQGIKNSPSLTGISHFPGEKEVFVADYKWKVANISDQRQHGDGFYHIYLTK